MNWTRKSPPRSTRSLSKDYLSTIPYSRNAALSSDDDDDSSSEGGGPSVTYSETIDCICVNHPLGAS